MRLHAKRSLEQYRHMLTDLILAALHHLAIVSLIVLLAVEFALLRPGITRENLGRVTKVDAAYGATASLVIVIGICRVIFGIKGAGFYLSNPWFWAKMASFAAIGLLSIPPTLALMKWRKASGSDRNFLPQQSEVARLRRFIHAEVALLGLVVIFAAAMARYGGF